MGIRRKRWLTAAMCVIASVSIFLPKLSGGNKVVLANSEKKKISQTGGALVYNSNTENAATVYFGADGTEPITWRVAGTNQFGVGAGDNQFAYTLVSSDVVGDPAKFYVTADLTNQYYRSNLKARMDGIYDSCFSEVEAAVIRSRTLKVEEYKSDAPYSDGVAGKQVENAKVWALSTYEAYQLDASIRNAKNNWWLRTPGFKNDQVAYIRNDGNVSYLGEYYGKEQGVRP